MIRKSEIPHPKSLSEPDGAGENRNTEADLPPFVKTWNQFYILLIIWLIILIASFYAFTKFFE